MLPLFQKKGQTPSDLFIFKMKPEKVFSPRRTFGKTLMARGSPINLSEAEHPRTRLPACGWVASREKRATGTFFNAARFESREDEDIKNRTSCQVSIG